ncbi:uncharacterized protein LOC110733495 [Chenopodium quinoa]|uniref:uncharacterized protein LOC110733495 n=1 Tax=Chenopodium quinoa TaxID=63459 RepID=UPI000B7888AF|nr:uncharacterized protein LOC110733495 [Chenopodium quinoa]
MIMGSHYSSKLILFLVAILFQVNLNSVFAGTCEYGTRERNKLYSYSLTSPVKNFPHGVLSEDGFYKVAANDTIIWFQLCDGMIFNHDPPRCVDCWDCGGPSRCGMGCSALVAKNTGGYLACTTIGREMNFDINLTDRKSPDKGVTITMSSITDGVNCSLSVSVICDSKGVKEPETFKKLGPCHYATELRHPSGCPKIAVHASGWGWFSFLLTILLCSVGAYLLIGGAYRYFSLGIRGLDVIPNLDFWISLPHNIKSFFMSLAQRFRGPTYHHRSSYSSVNF